MTSNNNFCHNPKLSIYISDSTESQLRINQKDDVNSEDDDDNDELSSSFCSVESSVCDTKVDSSNVDRNKCRMKRCSESFFDAFPYADNHDNICRSNEVHIDNNYNGDNECDYDEDDDIENYYVDDDDDDDDEGEIVDADREQGKTNICTFSESDGTADCLNEELKVKESTPSKFHQRHIQLLNAPSRVNFRRDRQSIMAAKQNALNNFVLKESKATIVNRSDHHIMLRQLVSEAYFRDPQRRQHRPQWKKIIAAVRKEYWGAKAIFNLSPDPYQDVLAKLSSMMLWNDNNRHWNYAYCTEEVQLRHARQSAILNELQRKNKLFLS